jgi:uncharacterized protein (DUF1501 family)
MSKKHQTDLSRRGFVAGSGAAALGSLLPGPAALGQAAGKDRKYLFVVCAAGGANIVDSFLAQSTGAVAYTGLVKPAGSAFSAAPVLQNSIQGGIALGNGYAQATFLNKHGADMVVMTCEVSSVNHQVAAKRAMTGDNIFGGRTLPEAVAMHYGKDLPLANLMLAGGGYANPGDDVQVIDTARGQFVSDPLMFAFATHGSRGISKTLSYAELSQVRELRKRLEQMAQFQTQFKGSQLLDRYLDNRERVVKMLEQGDSITKLMMLDPTEANLASFGLEASPDFDTLRSKFPNLAGDPFEARMALGFLAVKNGLSTAVSISPPATPLITAQGSPNAPIAFDWSHVDHRGAQNAMWSYILKSTDSLIDLLKATDVDGDPAKGKMWDRSLVYIATEFGRDKVASGGSGHNLNNGVIMLSPMLAGNRVFGGVDPATGFTHGFDRATGEPQKGTNMKEADVFSAAAMALGIDFERRRDVKVMMRRG